MTVRFSGFLCAAAGFAVLCAVPVFGQKQAFTPSKGWYNQPDLQGIWMPAKPIDNLEKGGFIKDPSNGKIPYVAGWKGQAGHESEERQNGGSGEPLLYAGRAAVDDHGLSVPDL